MVVDWGKTTVDQARAALEILEYNVAGVAFNKVDYAEHARRGYGDAVQYYTHASVYYNDKPQPRKYEWLLQRLEAVKDRIWSRSEEHTSELQSLMRISYAVFCLKKKKNKTNTKVRREQPKIQTQ